MVVLHVFCCQVLSPIYDASMSAVWLIRPSAVEGRTRWSKCSALPHAVKTVLIYRRQRASMHAIDTDGCQPKKDTADHPHRLTGVCRVVLSLRCALTNTCCVPCGCCKLQALKGLQGVIGMSATHPTWQKTRPDDDNDR